MQLTTVLLLLLILPVQVWAGITTTTPELAIVPITVAPVTNQTTVSGSPVVPGGTVTIGTVQDLGTVSSPIFQTTTLQLLSGTGNRCVYTDSLGILHAEVDACGLASATGDNLGNHVMQQNLRTMGWWLSRDGTDAGIFLDASQRAGFGTATPAYRVDVSGEVNISTGSYRIAGAALNFTNLAGTTSCAQLPALTGGVTTSACVATVITNANMTGPITGTGNVTSITAQTGTGTTFAMSVSPTFTGSVAMPSGIWNSSGNVGVGTVSPGERLEVAGNIRAGTGFSTMVAPQFGGLLVGEYGAGGPGEIQFLTTTAGSGYGFRLVGDSSDTSLRLQRRASSSSWSDFLAFSSSGSVGIGTTTPGSALDVVGQGRFDEVSGTVLRLDRITSGNNIDIDFHNPIATAGVIAKIRTDGDGLSNLIGALSFQTAPTVPGTLVERMRIMSSGNVGIRTATPGSALHVIGGVQIGAPTGGDPGTGWINVDGGYQVDGVAIGFSGIGGSVACSQLPALTGGVTSSAGSCATTVVTNANLTGPVTSVGNATSVTANAITTAMLATATGLTSAAVGDLLYASATTPVWSRLADVAAGSYLRSGGVNVAPLWSTLILPNAVTAGSVVFASATNTYGQDNASLFFDDANNRLGVGTASPAVKLHVGDGTAQTTVRVSGASGANMASVVSMFRAGAAEWIVAGGGGLTTNLTLAANPAGYSDAQIAAAALLTLAVGGGVQVGAPTGGDPGAGWINVDAGYKVDGVAVPTWAGSQGQIAWGTGTNLSGSSLLVWDNATFALNLSRTVLNALAPLTIASTLTGNRSAALAGTIPLPQMYGPPIFPSTAWEVSHVGGLAIRMNSTTTVNAPDTVNNGYSSHAMIAEHNCLAGMTGFCIGSSAYMTVSKNSLDPTGTNSANDSYGTLAFVRDNSTLVALNTVASYHQLTVSTAMGGLKAAIVAVLSNHGAATADRVGISITPSDITDTVTSVTAEDALLINTLASNGAGAFTVEGWQNAISVRQSGAFGARIDRFRVAASTGATYIGAGTTGVAGSLLNVASGGNFVAQAAGPVQVYLKTVADVPNQGILSHIYNTSAAGESVTTVATDKVAVSGWTFRGPGGSSPIYGGNFGVRFLTSGAAANGVEIDVENEWGNQEPDDAAGGRGLWVNGTGAFNRFAAIAIDTESASRWYRGIYLGPDTTVDNSGAGAGLFFDRSSSNEFILIRPNDDVAGNAIRLTSAGFNVDTFTVTKVGLVTAFTGFATGASVGVSCPSGINAATFRSVGGIVTAC